MARAGILSLLAVLALTALASWRQHGVIRDQERQLGELTVAHAALARNLDSLRAARAADDRIVSETASRAEAMTNKARVLERKLREAARHEADFDRRLSRHVTDALCLRWLSASGAHGGDFRDAAGNAHAETHDPAAAGCDSWAGMTVRDAVEWSGLLLDHAGLERLDKEALRQWLQANR